MKSLVAFSDEVFAEHTALKRFLHESLYQHEKVRSMTGKAQQMLEDIFKRYMLDPGEMSDEFSSRASGDESTKARAVADYIAGMTDRFAIAEHERLT